MPTREYLNNSSLILSNYPLKLHNYKINKKNPLLALALPQNDYKRSSKEQRILKKYNNNSKSA